MLQGELSLLARVSLGASSSVHGASAEERTGASKDDIGFTGFFLVFFFVGFFGGFLGLIGFFCFVFLGFSRVYWVFSRVSYSLKA